MTMTSNPPPSPSNWEDAETQPQPPRPNQSATAGNTNISPSNNNNNNNNRERSSLDLDKTLPLPADMEAELLESQRVNRRRDNDDDESNSSNNNSAINADNGPTNEESILLAKLQKWTSPQLNNNDTTITETDVAQLLSFASKLHSGQLSWNPTSYRVIQLMVQVAMLSFNANFSSSNMNNHNNSDGGSNSNNVAVASTSTNNNTAMTAASRMESQYARRLLTDAILPFASLHNSSNSVAVWNAKLIQSIVQYYLVPSVVVSNDTVVSTTAAAAAAGAGSEGSSTTAVELLLDHFLARMDADEIGQVVRLNPGHIDYIPTINLNL